MNKAILPFINLILVLGLILYLVFSNMDKKVDYVYVDNFKLFNGFNMAKELNEKHSKTIAKQTKALDSTYKLYQIAAQNKEAEKLPVLQLQLQKQDEELKKSQEFLSKEVSKQVWTRLNGYIKDFGKAEDLEIILGAQGNGNVMYAKDFRDYTDEILIYANNKYEGN